MELVYTTLQDAPIPLHYKTSYLDEVCDLVTHRSRVVMVSCHSPCYGSARTVLVVGGFARVDLCVHVYHDGNLFC